MNSQPYYTTFAYDPESVSPSGSLNFSRIQESDLQVSFKTMSGESFEQWRIEEFNRTQELARYDAFYYDKLKYFNGRFDCRWDVRNELMCY